MSVLTTRDNPAIDTRPDEIKAFNKVVDFVKTKEQATVSVPNVVTQTIKPRIAEIKNHLYYDNVGLSYYNIEYWSNGYAVFTVDNTGFPNPPAGGADPFISDYFLQNPELQKITNIQEINLSTKITERFFPTFRDIPIATSNYSFDYFITLGVQNTNIDIDWGSFYEVYKELTYLKWTYTYTLATNSWTVSTRPLTKRWSPENTKDETITSNYWGIPRQNFTNFPNAISTENWNKLISQGNFLNINSGFSSNVNSLTGVNLLVYQTTPSNSNKAHFQHYFGGYYNLSTINASFLSPAYLLTVTLNFNYFGLLKPFAPLS